MISKLLAPTLIASVLFAGLTATPAFADTPAPTPSVDQSTAIEGDDSPVTPTDDTTVSPAPVASSTPTPEPTSTPTPTGEPTIKQVPTSSAAATGEPKPAPAPTATLKPTVASGALTGKTFSVPKLDWYVLKGKVSVGGGQRDFKTQIYNSSTKTWSDSFYGRTNADGSWLANLTSTKDSSQKLRIVVPKADNVYQAYTGPTTVVNRTKSKATIQNINVGSFRGVPWERKYFSFFIPQQVGKVQVQLQKRVSGGKWKYVAKTYTKPGANQYKIAFPVGNSKSKNQTVNYRVALSESFNYKAATSAASNVYWENPKLYKGTAKTVYNYMSGKCPNVLVRMDSGLLKNHGAWGQAVLGTGTDYMKVYSKVPAKHLRTVALHECGHFWQWKTANNKNNTGWAAYRTAANGLFKTSGDTGMERVNECISASFGPHSYWSYGASRAVCGRPTVLKFVKDTIAGRHIA